MKEIKPTILILRLWFLTVVINVLLIAIYTFEDFLWSGYVTVIGFIIGLLCTAPILVLVKIAVKLVKKLPYEIVGRFATLCFLLLLSAAIYYTVFLCFILRELNFYMDNEIMLLIYSTFLSIFIACILSLKQIRNFYTEENEIAIN